MKKYDPEVHPQGIIDYFQGFLKKLEKAERVQTKHGDVKHVQAPVSPPLLAGYAVEIGVCRETLWEWAEKYPQFKQAHDFAKAIQELVFIEMGAKGGWNPKFSELMMKNLQGWKDKREQEHVGTIVLNFDEQDSRA